MQHNLKYKEVTEISGDEISQEQLIRLCSRYYWAEEQCRGKDVLEVACGAGAGLGYLAQSAKSIEACDIDPEIIEIAKSHYKDRFKIVMGDAHQLPFDDSSKDVIILFEALYYIQDVEKFLSECKRILRPNGILLISLPNKSLYDFNPSPLSHRYFTISELNNLLSKYNFKTNFLGGTKISSVSWRQKILRPIKKIAVSLNLVPKSMNGKKFLKKLVFGELIYMPHEIQSTTSEKELFVNLDSNKIDLDHKVIYSISKLS
jgi:ubiquinone/menaquinone biosynthesis C-methylase UbiE